MGDVRKPGIRPESEINRERTAIIYEDPRASHGWEWLNPVRGEEWFAEAVERAKKTLEE